MNLRSIHSSFLLILLISAISFLPSCRKEKLLNSGGSLEFSVDTLTFDTVFTSMGSFTVDVRIINRQNQKINVSSVRLAKGDTSFFHLNVDGAPGNSASNIEVAPNDSFHVFATVKIDPRNQNNPFVIEDRLIATLNGKDFSIPVMAYGQDANYIVDSYLQTQTWSDTKPYVIIHNAAVDTGQVLTIPAGCRVYMHGDSRLYVLKDASLKVLGTKTDTVVFQGDRLDRDYFGYEGYPGEWGGIYFTSYSYNSEIHYAVLKNCGSNTGAGLPSAIQLEPDLLIGDSFQLTITHSRIENSIGYGILSFKGSLKAENCLITACGAQALAIVQGGDYEINNCDFVVYNSDKINHLKEPAVAILNYFDIGNNQYIADDLNAVLRNCVIWGSLEDEAFFDRVDKYKYNLTLENCALRKKDAIPDFVVQKN
ncbi:MAG: hypothetical protein K0R82_2036, partial [Flavipsychrobacter sp.]|nr:hypothetical protein [Flavipsychrobacter sp.]